MEDRNSMNNIKSEKMSRLDANTNGAGAREARPETIQWIPWDGGRQDPKTYLGTKINPDKPTIYILSDKDKMDGQKMDARVKLAGQRRKRISELYRDLGAVVDPGSAKGNLNTEEILEIAIEKLRVARDKS